VGGPRPAARGVRRLGLEASRAGQTGRMFLFFSNRLGCFGSLLVSAIITVVLLIILGVL
jgi:hypothetical protein